MGVVKSLFSFSFFFLIKRRFGSFSAGINMIKSPETKAAFVSGGKSENEFVISHHTDSSRPKNGKSRNGSFCVQKSHWYANKSILSRLRFPLYFNK